MPLFKLQNQKRPSTASSVPTLKPLLFQYSLYRLIAYSIARSAAPTTVLPGTDFPPRPPLATPLRCCDAKEDNPQALYDF